jgi:hypothetical protein
MMANALTVESIRKSATIMLLASANVDPEIHRFISPARKNHGLAWTLGSTSEGPKQV